MADAELSDLVKLKLKKKLLLEKVDQTDHRLDRLQEIMKKKTLKNSQLSNSLSSSGSSSSLSFSSKLKNTQTSFGVPVSDFLIRNVPKQLPPSFSQDITSSLVPQAVLNHSILKRRQEEKLHKASKELLHTNHLKALQKKQKPSNQPPSISIPPSNLPHRYERGELPCTIEHGSTGNYLSWICPLEKLDYEYYLPLFFDGLQVYDNTIISFITRQAIEDLLYSAKERKQSQILLPVIKSLVRPTRNALMTYNKEVILAVLRALSQLITCDKTIAPELLKYSKQFLAPISYFMGDHRNIGDGIDYGQRKNNDVGEEIQAFLELLEQLGGPGALKQIKFSIPLYESCMKDRL